MSLVAILAHPANPDLLWEQVFEVFQTRVRDFSLSADRLRVEVVIPAKYLRVEDQATLEQIAAAHTPDQLTAAQNIEQRKVQSKTEWGNLAVLARATPDQTDAWVDSSITGFNAATMTALKQALKVIFRALMALAHRGDIED